MVLGGWVFLTSEAPLYISLPLNVLLTESGLRLIDQRVIRLIQMEQSRVVYLILEAKRHAARTP